LLTGMTGNSLHIQYPTSVQSHFLAQVPAASTSADHLLLPHRRLLLSPGIDFTKLLFCQKIDKFSSSNFVQCLTQKRLTYIY
jgi:hypothetical protein